VPWPFRSASEPAARIGQGQVHQQGNSGMGRRDPIREMSAVEVQDVSTQGPREGVIVWASPDGSSRRTWVDPLRRVAVSSSMLNPLLQRATAG
jgi:hypothetical protein